MFNSKTAQEMAKQFMEALPPSLHLFNEEAKITLRLWLQSAFEKMDLVTREEFETQTLVLTKTRKKLEECESQLQSLEKALSSTLSKIPE